MGLSGNPGRPQIDNESQNDVTRLWWHAGAIFVLLAELGLRKSPSGNPEGLTLLGEPGGGAFGWVCGGTDCGDCGDCGRKIVRGKCRRITLTLSSVLT